MNPFQRASLTLKRLSEKYKNYPLTGLTNWKTDWQFLFAVILSAQANDDQINKVTPTLFKEFQTLDDFKNADLKSISNVIRSVGFFNSKAKYLKQSATILSNEYKEKIPQTIKELTRLPGVGRKTANVYQGVILGKSEGIAVDTHVARMSKRLKLTNQKAADKIEKDLMKIFPKGKYNKINPILFWHGRTICLARKPQCEKCQLVDFCPSSTI
jgi:endonuclease-3